MEDVIRWVESRNKPKETRRVPAARLNQFEKNGYRIHQYDEEFFMVERIKSGKPIQCMSISDAEIIVRLAIEYEKKNLSATNPKQSLVDKALSLVGLIDVMYGSKNGDKIRRRIGNGKRSKVQNSGKGLPSKPKEKGC